MRSWNHILYTVTEAMSWDSYIDNLISQSKDAVGAVHVDRACIIGLDNGAPWTTAGHPNAFKLQGNEAANIARCFKSKDFTWFMQQGVYAEGQYYVFLRELDGTTVFAKSKGRGSVTLQSSKSAVVIAHCPDDKQQGNCNKAVSVIAEYLESMNM